MQGPARAGSTYVGRRCLSSRCSSSEWRARSCSIFMCMSYKGAIVLEIDMDKTSDNRGLQLLCNSPVSACGYITDVRLEACWSPCQRCHRWGLLDPFGSKSAPARSDPAPVRVEHYLLNGRMPGTPCLLLSETYQSVQMSSNDTLLPT